MAQVIRRHGLSDEVLNHEISDIHVDKISRSSCKMWRHLYPYLELDEIIIGDVERDYSAEAERRKGLINRWRAIKGSEATYKTLVYALLKISQLQDAENVCKLLADQGMIAQVITQVGGLTKVGEAR